MSIVSEPLTTAAQRRASGFVPIADYGLLADCHSCALVDRDGSIDWLCMPHYDSPAVFARLLDPDAGHWSIAPVGPSRSERRYLPGTLVIETTFITPSGTVRLIDAMAFAEGQRGHDLGRDAPHEVLRLVEGVSGSVDVAMELAPRPEYGLVRPLFRMEERGGRTFGGPNQIAVSADVPVTVQDAAMRASFTLTAGQRACFSLRWADVISPRPQATPPEQVAARITDTIDGWRSWEAEHDIYEGPHRELVRLSARVLKGLTFRPTGAIVAAATTPLPEGTGGERNWDYRFSWIRDSSLTLEALYIGACSDEAEEFVSFMTSAAGGPGGEGSLQNMYGIGGEAGLAQRGVAPFPRWRRPGAGGLGKRRWNQVQLDVYGELLNALHVYRERLGDLHPEIQRFVADLADTAARRWTEKDSGIWEMRGEPLHHLSSKVMCWVALDRAVKLAPALGEHAKLQEWTAARDAIREAIETRGWSEARQAYAQ